MNPLAVAMAMLVLITTPRRLATLRNFWTFKFISIKRSGLPCSFSSCSFEDRFPFVACLISIRYFDLNVQKVLSLRFLDFDALSQQSFHSLRHISRFRSALSTRMSIQLSLVFFLARNPQEVHEEVYVLNKQWNLIFKESLWKYTHFLRFPQNWVHFRK